MEKVKIKAVYFDAGETLIYRNPSLTTLTARAVKAAGFSGIVEKVENALAAAAVKMAPIVSRGMMKDSEKWDVYMRMVFKRLKVNDSRAEKNLKQVLKKGRSFRPFPDALPVLKALRKKGIKTGIISNAPGELRSILDATGISGHAEDIIVSEETGFEKPDVRIFLKALKNAGCRGEEMLFVGDNLIADIEGAAKAGIKPLWLKRRTRHAQFSFAGRKTRVRAAVIRKLSEVLGHI